MYFYPQSYLALSSPEKVFFSSLSLFSFNYLHLESDIFVSLHLMTSRPKPWNNFRSNNVFTKRRWFGFPFFFECLSLIFSNSFCTFGVEQMARILVLKNCLFPLFTLSLTKYSSYLQCRICHGGGGCSPWCYANCRYPRQTLTPTVISSSCSYLLIRPPLPHQKKKMQTNTHSLTPPLLFCPRPSRWLT